MQIVNKILSNVFVLLLWAAPIAALNVNYSFNSPSGNLGNTESYTNSGITITAYGFSGPSITADLFGKNDGGDEKGLGINNTPNHEIEGSYFVQLNLSQLLAQITGPITVQINSSTSPDSWAIYGSNSLGSVGTFLLNSGTSENPFLLNSLASNYGFISVVAPSGDILLKSITANVAVPEPMTMLILGSGLAVAAMAKQKKA